MSIVRNGITDTDLDIPVILPTLSLDFANSQSLDPRITFTRGSTGTRVNKNGLIEVVPVNQPRFDYAPISGECKGLLIEESRTNQMVRSDIEGTVGAQPTGMLLVGPGNGQSAVVSTDVFIGPNGQSCKHTRGTFSDNNIGYMGATVTPGSTYVFSAYIYIPSSQAKNFEGKLLIFNMESAYTSRTTASADVTIVDRWQRVTGTCVPSGTSATWVLRTTANTGSFFYTDCWQLELGSFPTSYIPTTASTVTRSADNASMTGTNFSSWYNQSEGSFLFNFYISSGIDSIQRQIFRTDDLTTTNRMGYYDRLGNNPQFRFEYQSTTTNTGLPDWKVGNNKVAFAYSSSKSIFSTNSTLTNLNYKGIPQGQSRFYIGNDSNITGYLNGTISRLTYYPKALSPSQLQYLTQ